MVLCVLLGMMTRSAVGGGSEDPPRDVRCGAYCLYVALEALDLAPREFSELEASLGPPGARGFSLHQLAVEARIRGAEALGVHTSLGNLKRRSLDQSFLCIAKVSGSHFVVVHDIDEINVHYIDPPRDAQAPTPSFEQIWDGSALLLSKQSLVPLARPEASLLTYYLAIGGCFLAAAFSLIGIRRWWRARVGAALLSAGMVIVSGCGEGRATVPRHPEAAPSGRFVVVPEEVELGNVFRLNMKTTVTAKAMIKNIGDSSINIKGSTIQCDCTNVMIPVKLLPPRGEVPIEVTIKLGDTAEPRSTRVVIHSDVKDDPDRTLTINWRTTNPLTTESESLHLPSVAPGIAKSIDEKIFCENLSLCESCKIVVEPRSSFVEAAAVPEANAPRPGHDFAESRVSRTCVAVLRVKLLPQLDYQMYSDNLAVEVVCGGVTRARYVLPMSWTVIPELSVTPTRLSLGVQPPNSVIEQSLILRSSRGSPFIVKSVSANTRDLVAWDPSNDDLSTVQLVKLRVTTPNALGPWRSFVTIETSHNDPASVEIPISGVGVGDIH